MHDLTIHALDQGVFRELEAIAWKRGLSVDEATREVLIEATGSGKSAILAERFAPCTD